MLVKAHEYPLKMDIAVVGWQGGGADLSEILTSKF